MQLPRISPFPPTEDSSQDLFVKKGWDVDCNVGVKRSKYQSGALLYM